VVDRVSRQIVRTEAYEIKKKIFPFEVIFLDCRQHGLYIVHNMVIKHVQNKNCISFTVIFC
jgi:hypothetical protein